VTVAARSSRRKVGSGRRDGRQRIEQGDEIIQDKHLTPIAPYKSFGAKRTLGDLPTSVNCHADMRHAPTRVTKLGFSAVEDCESYSDARPFEAAAKKGKTR
jgi:hypothetical protein